MEAERKRENPVLKAYKYVDTNLFQPLLFISFSLKSTLEEEFLTMASFSPVAPLENNFPFEIVRHSVPVVSFREYPHAIVDEEKGLRLSVKQYRPRNAPSPSTSNTNAITIIAAGGLGFIKELYEPLFAELFYGTQHSGMSIRSIWIADMFNVGESAVLNRHNLGCDPAWIDHSRDLWSVINHFHGTITKPIIGLGHSIGCNQLLCLSSWHPTLFHSFAFIEPGIDQEYGRGITIPWSYQTLRQKDAWLTREEAETDLVKAHDARGWDGKVLARLKHYGVFQNGADQNDTWALTTPKDQIVALVSRFNAGRIGLGPGGVEKVTLAERELVPDSDPIAFNLGPFYRRELKLAWDMISGMRPWVLYVNGGESPFFGCPQTRDERARQTGTGVGGNGGMKLGAVKQVVIEDGKHTMVFDHNVERVADYVADWLVVESRRWNDLLNRRRDRWLGKSAEEKQTVGSDYVAALISEMEKMTSSRKL